MEGTPLPPFPDADLMVRGHRWAEGSSCLNLDFNWQSGRIHSSTRKPAAALQRARKTLTGVCSSQLRHHSCCKVGDPSGLSPLQVDEANPAEELKGGLAFRAASLFQATCGLPTAPHQRKTARNNTHLFP